VIWPGFFYGVSSSFTVKKRPPASTGHLIFIHDSLASNDECSGRPRRRARILTGLELAHAFKLKDCRTPFLGVPGSVDPSGPRGGGRTLLLKMNAAA